MNQVVCLKVSGAEFLPLSQKKYLLFMFVLCRDWCLPLQGDYWLYLYPLTLKRQLAVKGLECCAERILGFLGSVLPPNVTMSVRPSGGCLSVCNHNCSPVRLYSLNLYGGAADMHKCTEVGIACTYRDACVQFVPLFILALCNNSKRSVGPSGVCALPFGVAAKWSVHYICYYLFFLFGPSGMRALPLAAGKAIFLLLLPWLLKTQKGLL